MTCPQPVVRVRRAAEPSRPEEAEGLAEDTDFRPEDGGVFAWGVARRVPVEVPPALSAAGDGAGPGC
jgi:hypothetical protein